MAYYYDENGSLNPQPPRKKESDVISWAGIAFLFLIGLWPIGLFLLISKLSDSRTAAKNDTAATYHTSSYTSAEKDAQAHHSSKVGDTLKKMTKTPQFGSKGAAAMKWIGIALIALGALAALGTIGSGLSQMHYAGWVWRLVGELFYPVGIMAGGVATLLGGRSMTRRQRRFAKYLAVAGSDQSVSLKYLARAAEVTDKKLLHDLEIMVEKGLWGAEAYVDVGAGMLFRSHEAARQYNARNAAIHAVPAQTAQGYSGILRQIHAANDRIADPILSQKIDRIEEVAGRIFRIIEAEPEKKTRSATFLNYYLPTTQKLLDSYAEFEEAGVSGTNLDQAKHKIERTMDSIVAGFERQLDQLYQEDAMDIDSDIQVMETMLRRDGGSVEQDFGLGGTAAQRKKE